MFIKEIEESLINHHKANKRWLFTQKFQDSEFIKKEFLEKYNAQLEEVNTDSIYLFESLALYCLDRVQYQLKNSTDIKEIKDLISMSCEYSLMSIGKGNDICGCMELNPYLNMQRAGILFGLIIQSKKDKYILEAGTALIDSLNAKRCIIKRGSSKALNSWFMIELFGQINNIKITKKRTYFPKDYYPYDEVLKNWDIEDLKEVDKLTYLLAEMHLTLDEEDDKLLHMSFIQLFPYEILAWLKLRELKGLKNPKTFSHPLMNTPIAKMFLELKEPLEKPKELPFADELIAKLKEKCPDKEIEKQEPKATLKEKITPLKGLAPKTGRYRATLPNEHPQAKQLESDPHSYARFKKDDTFTYEGLEDYDLSEIIWSYLGE